MAVSTDIRGAALVDDVEGVVYGLAATIYGRAVALARTWAGDDSSVESPHGMRPVVLPLPGPATTESAAPQTYREPAQPALPLPEAPQTLSRRGGSRTARTTPAAGNDGTRGALQALVLAHVTHGAGVEFTSSQVSKALDRSSGAVGNALERLAEAGAIVRTSDSPRRYAAAPTR